MRTITEDIAREIRKSPDPQQVLADQYGLSIASVWRIRRRKQWISLAGDETAEAPNHDGEQWRTIHEPGYDAYEVSSIGSIRKRDPALPRPRRRFRTSPLGYSVVVLCRNNKQRKFFVHRLVAIAFLGPVPLGKQINHKDGHKTNNLLDNLEYVTAKENTAHAFRLGLRHRGERSSFAKLKNHQVLEIMSDPSVARILAARFNVSISAVHRIRAGHVWSHLTHPQS